MFKFIPNVFSSFLLSFFIVSSLFAQSFNGKWSCAYATIDDQPNSTGIQTISMAVVSENNFVALVSQAAKPWVATDACYLVGYRNADSTNGRLGNYAYSTKWNQLWVNGFDAIAMDHARDLRAKGDLIFVANNDPDANILVFELGADSVVTYPLRMKTNTNPFNSIKIYAIDIDEAGRVYVTTEGDSLNPSEVLIYESPDKEPAWSTSYDAAPIQRFSLPENGDARGIAVTPDGSALYVSNFVTEKVYCYVGDPINGYQLYSGFDFTLTDEPVVSDQSTIDPAPLGIRFIPQKNILAVACQSDFKRGLNYEYGRVYLLNPNTGAILDTLDIAKWNFDRTGSYSTRPGGTLGNVSGYTSVYNVDVDENYNLYTNSYYGWTIDKWTYSVDLPTIDLLITGIERDTQTIPTEFVLAQNYPNPFNPSTTIEFSVIQKSNITLSIYSLTGELISQLINNSEFGVGVYKVNFDASKLASGTYLYTINNGTQTISRKMILVK
ncbi:MAG: T9SS type A sorting domain-containing protein [Bacteroidetes bacterium]|nr:T9SS type A sorting domain-containing protein [Bacteroidota bacterium]